MADKLAKATKKHHEKLKSKRQNWDSHWQEIADYIAPNKDDVFVKQNTTGGEKKTNKRQLFDATAIHSNSLLASALHGMLTNPTTLWFELTTGDPELDKDDNVKKWLQKAVNIMHQTLNNSNFQTEIHEVYLDLCSFGTGSMRIEEDKDLIVRFHSRPIFELYIAENSKGEVDTVSREYKLDGRQIFQEFGEDMFSEDELRQIKKDLEKEWDIIHMVRPRKDVRVGRKGPKAMPFASIHVLCDMSITLKESGFDEFPYITPRWSKISGEIYGRSPGMNALPDIKMINEIMKTTIIAAQKIVDPPLQVPDDGMLMPLRTTPGSLNYYRAGTKDLIVPLETKGRPDLGFQLMEQIKLQIRQAFFIDQLQLNEGPQMTATEVIQRTEEKLRLLGPVLGRLHFELLKPLIDRVFGILMRTNKLPQEEIPDVLENADLDVRFSSAIARAQRTTEVDNLNRALQTLVPMVEIKPEIADNLNADETVAFVFDRFNIPQDLLTSDEDKKEIREGRAEQEAAIAQSQQELEDSEKIKNAAPALTEQ